MTGKDTVLGIVAALPAEARAAGVPQAPAGEAVSLGDRVLLVRCGVGRVRAARAAAALLAAGAGSLLSWGTAAALAPGIEPGDLVLPGEVLAGDGRRYPVSAAWRGRIAALAPARAGTVAEPDSVLRNADDKLLLRTLCGAEIADMESAAVAEAAARAGVPLLVARAVSDGANARLPDCALAALDADGQVRVGPFLGRLLLAPGDLPALIRLAVGFRAACRSLTRLAGLAGPEFQAQTAEAQA